MLNNRVFGNGVDIVKVERIEKILDKNKKDIFLMKVFTDGEIAYFETLDYNPESIAGYFAVKEAVMKTLGAGLSSIAFKDIEIIKDELGKPYLLLHGKAKEIAKKKNVDDFEISIAHEKEYAIAFVVGISK